MSLEEDVTPHVLTLLRVLRQDDESGHIRNVLQVRVCTCAAVVRMCGC